jgi:ribosomal protein S18 acetylase RimI-like enzyme
MRIKRLAAGDEDLLDNAVRVFRGVEGADHAAFLADPGTLTLLALSAEGDLLGWAWGVRQRHVAGYTQVQLYDVAVVEGARRRGVGRALVAEFVAVVKAEGHAKMWLFTGADNAPARALYASLGGGPSASDHTSYWWPLR